MSFDDIVIGAGSCGGVLASRLSEDPARSVLVLEAGPYYRTAEEMPRDLTHAFTSSVRHDWGFAGTVRGARVIPYPRGKVVGGSSAVNGSIALRNDPYEWDEWAALGFQEWRWDAMLPYFRMLENDADGHAINPDVHGLDGPMPVRHAARDTWQPLHRAFFDSCRGHGIDHAPDLNAPGAHGVGVLPMNKIDGVRQSIPLTYLKDAPCRPNLVIRGDVLVDRIVVEHGRAVAVDVVDGGRRERIEGSRISLATGAIQTPAILLRSGFGDALALRALDIDVVAHLPGVGATLRDHPSCGIALAPDSTIESDPGVFTQVAARLTSERSPTPNDLQVGSVTMYDLAQAAETFPIESPILLLWCVLMRPTAHGSVTITCTDPATAPRIDMNFLSTDDDMVRMIEMWRLSRDLARTEPLRSMITDILTPDEVIADDTRCAHAIGEMVSTTYHGQSTAPMGRDVEGGAVVDERGRVYGVEGLHVVDISVMPVSCNSNTHLTALAIAERFADWMR